ncbi:glycoside hydrolase family 5 protein [Patellaria atrata CBS 101060]|uniref:mannan endo-1,4-beta-mannosidase n=1 Tax=Patellaria atrata CBS 101060 TaxID=1346257 RepID=A0A9P4SIG2_9PEZI|nr:glycoside hydrolase family 5 protein [Patellaria atrata CBS 101060]
MKLLSVLLVSSVAAQLGAISSVVRNGSELQLNGKRWTASGANVYWLGLDENVGPTPGEPYYEPTKASYPSKGRVTEIMNVLQVLGATTIRSHTLGVSTGNPLSLWPTLRQTNEAAFEAIDWAVYQAREHGIRLIVPLTDNYDYYHGGRYNFLRWRGINVRTTLPTDPAVMQFYTNRTIVDDFKEYIRTLLTHVNPYTGLTYAEDPTIVAYETGNELGGAVFQDLNVPVTWTTDISAYIKELGPSKLVVDGTYGIQKVALKITTVDIYSNHFWPANIPKLTTDIAAVGAASKTYIAGEYEWTGNSQSAAPLTDWFAVVEAQQNKSQPVVVGDHLWSLFGHAVPDCSKYVDHADGNTMHYGNPSNSAKTNAQISAVRQHLFKMKGEAVGTALPIAPCPGAGF